MLQTLVYSQHREMFRPHLSKKQEFNGIASGKLNLDSWDLHGTNLFCVQPVSRCVPCGHGIKMIFGPWKTNLKESRPQIPALQANLEC